MKLNDMNKMEGHVKGCTNVCECNEHYSQCDEAFQFEVPTEAPVFQPTEEEFLDPLAYIAKIRPVAEKAGICKIKPPARWQPPFAVDVDKLRFTPRIQRLNELEATTRVKLNFLDQIAKFWELQGSSLKIPMVERRVLDLYTLHRVVKHEGGFNEVTKQRKWSKVSIHLGYQIGKNVGAILKQHYERLIYPFDVFKEGKKVPITIDINEDGHEISTDKDYTPHGIVNRMAVKPPSDKNARSSKRFQSTENDKTEIELKIQEQKCDAKNKDDEEDDGNKDTSKELKRLQFLGPGPKIALYDEKIEFKPRAKHIMYNVNPLAKCICRNCNCGDTEEYMLLCDGCDDSYHPFCLIPPSTKIPKRDWRCPNCVAEEVSKPSEAFGFEQAEREYTLQQFGDMADSFKSDYFDMPVHTVPTSTVEREFWRIVSSIDEDVTVEYGADLHTMDHGSGFPTKLSANLLQGDKEYAESSWNLNNLPVLEGSVLGYINADISGMKVPWMYVGMCFSTFCWHNEDHWAYSINYLHWGEAKTWYGVPGSKAEKFEETMKSTAPELFHSQPDLLHQLVTIMNPNILMNVGVPVYRTDQLAGEFVVTFPRAYHAGFNQGYNFAEAVNFAPANWLKMGRDCILHYSNLRRFCVFAHDELVCKMALDNDKLDSTIADATYQDMLVMVDTEKKLRKTLLDWGVTNAEREVFELLPDDERQCEVCKTTCFLSAVTCSCISNTLVCLRHYKNLCECPSANRTLRYRYTLDELSIMLKALKLKADSFDHWLAKVKDALDPNTPKTFNLNDLKALLDEADRNKIPKCELLQTLTSAVIDAKKCASAIHQLETYLDQMRTRNRHSNHVKCKLTVELLTLICDEINSVACVFDEAKDIRDLLTKTQLFGAKSEELLCQSLQQNSLVELEECQNHGSGLCIDLPNLQLINTRIKQVQFMKEVDTYRKKSKIMEVGLIETLIQQGYSVPPHVEIKKELSNLQSIVHKSQEWEQRAQEFLKCQDPNILTQGEKLLEDASNIPCHLPTASIVSEAIKNSREWLKQLEEINSAEYYPYYNVIEELIRKGRLLDIHLVEVDRINECLILANAWKEKTCRVFLRKDSPTTLMDALTPRTVSPTSKSPKKGKGTENDSKSIDPATVSALFKKAEEGEMSIIRNIRQFNQQKSLEPNDLSFSYCVCGRGVFGVMMRCELCRDWFHSTCTYLPKIAFTKFKGNVRNIAVSLGFEGCKYICCNCQKSKRPRLDTILSLLKSLQKLHVRVPEGEALQGLTERAMNWQDRARQLLLTPELERAKIKLNNLSQKFTKDDAIQKTEISTTKMKTAFKNPELHDISRFSGVHEVGIACDSGINDDASTESTRNSDERMVGHAFSLHLPKNEVEDCVVRISPEVRRRMEELLMEGDLLEVSLDETVALWKLILSSRDHEREVMLIDLSTSPKTRDRKRLSLDPIDPAKTTPKTAKADRGKKVRRRKQQTPNKEEVCAAYCCQKPSGQIVDWVECDAGCEQWFHMACVGLTVEEINEDEDYYICTTCSRSTTSQNVETWDTRSRIPRSPDLT